MHAINRVSLPTIGQKLQLFLTDIATWDTISDRWNDCLKKSIRIISYKYIKMVGVRL